MGVVLEKSTDKRIQWIRKIERQIAEFANGKFSGKLIFALNMSQGGITECDIQTASKLS